MIKQNLTKFNEFDSNIQHSTNLKTKSNNTKRLKTEYYKSYEIEFLKYNTLIYIIYQENFQTLIGSKDNVTPFNSPILTDFKNKKKLMSHIKILINDELNLRKNSNLIINDFNNLDVKVQEEIQDFIIGYTNNFEIIKR